MREDFAQAIAAEQTLHGSFGTVAYGFGAIVDLITTALREYAAMFFRDFAYALRALRKTPSFAAIVIVTLGLAIGANAAVFSVLRTVVLDPLPYADPQRLVTLTPTHEPNVFSLPAYSHVVRGTPQIVDAAAFTSVSGTLSGRGAPQRLQGFVTTPGLFRTFGISPLLGRFADAHDVAKGAAKTIVISERLYRSAFGSDPNTIGSLIRLDDDAYRLIGIVPSAFAQPLPNRGMFSTVDYWKFAPEDGSGTEYGPDYSAFFVVARLEPAVSLASAQAAITSVVQRMRGRDPVHDADLAVRVDSLMDSLIGSVRPLLIAMFAAVFAVLLVACANVANLLLSRAASRDREFSVRIAIGASRGRIIAQLLVETFVLALGGGVIGIGLAYGAVLAFVASNPPNVPRANLVSVDGLAIAYTFGVVAFCTLAAGLAPAFTMAQRNVAIALKSAGRGGSAHRGARARSFLVATEIAMTLALVVGAGLVLKSFVTLTSQPLGFDSHDLNIIGVVDLSSRRYASAAAEEAFLNRALERVENVPGVAGASWGAGVPFGHGLFSTSVALDGRPLDPKIEANVQLSPVSAGYFSTMRVALRAGREFSRDDRADSAPVAIVNDAFARRYFVGRSPLGAYIVPAVSPSGVNPPRRRIVGVVADLRWKLTAPIEPVVYLPVRQLPMAFLDLVVRAVPGSDPGKAAAAAIVAIDPLMPLPAVVSMDASVAANVAVQRLTVMALCALAFVALALTIAGVFAVVSYGVTQRTHEFGVRMALGADARAIVRTVVTNAMRLAFCGIAGGLLIAGAGTRLLTDQLYETQPLDPLTFASVTTLVLLAAFAAALVPARRATRVDPIVALRYE